jgi:hypothetical protein
MSDPRDPRGRLVDPFDAPDDYADPWRGRRTKILLICIGLIVLTAVLWLTLD